MKFRGPIYLWDLKHVKPTVQCQEAQEGSPGATRFLASTVLCRFIFWVSGSGFRNLGVPGTVICQGT